MIIRDHPVRLLPVTLEVLLPAIRGHPMSRLRHEPTVPKTGRHFPSRGNTCQAAVSHIVRQPHIKLDKHGIMVVEYACSSDARNTVGRCPDRQDS